MSSSVIQLVVSFLPHLPQSKKNKNRLLQLGATSMAKCITCMPPIVATMFRSLKPQNNCCNVSFISTIAQKQDQAKKTS